MLKKNTRLIATLGLLVCVLSVPAQADKSRHIELDGQPNFRDLGGYKTTDGRTVKTGILYRSGELPNLSDDDVATLDTLGINTVVNFLTPEEISAKGSDRLLDGVTEILLPIEGGVAGDLTRDANHARKTGDFSKIPVELNPEIHRILVADGAEQYSRLLKEIAAGDSFPLVFHCSHGIHRTGTAAAIVLSLIGVPWETIREDYLLSNITRKEEVDKRLKELRRLAAQKQGMDEEQVDTTNMKAFYVLDGSYIDATLDEIEKQFGSMEQYARQELGLSDQELQNLRQVVLE